MGRPQTASGDIRVKKWRLSPRTRKQVFAYSLLAPGLVAVLAVTVYPILYSLYISFWRYNLLMPPRVFVGLQNYVLMFQDPEFISSLGRTLYFVVVSITSELLLGLLVALVLTEPFKGRGVVRALVLIPWAIPTIVNGVLWRWIYQPNYGAFNGLLHQLGFIDQYVNWLADPFRAMNMVILADAWHMVPFYTLLLLAALQGIPDSLYESAVVDGAGWTRRFLSVTLPLLKPMILVILVIRTIETFRVFDIIYALTRGGPGGGTEVIGYYAYERTFSFLDFGYGAAVAMVLTLCIVVLAFVYVKVLYEKDMAY